MLTKWKIFNFKSVQTETELALAPLTIFAGPNSSGKSTWIQSILLISQTLASKIPSPAAVVLNGNLAKLGQFDDLRSYKSEADQILIGWECEPLPSKSTDFLEESDFAIRISTQGNLPDKISGEIYFDADPGSVNSELTQLQPRLYRYEMSCTSKEEDRIIDATSKLSVSLATRILTEKITDLHVDQSDISPARNSLERDIELNEVALKDLQESGNFSETKLEPVGCTFSHHFLPSQLVVRYDAVQEEANLIASILLEGGLRVSLGNALTRIRRSRNPILPKAALDLLRSWLGDISLEPLLEQVQLKLPLGSDEDSSQLTLRDWIEHLQSLSPFQRSEIRQKLRTETSQEKLEELHQVLYQSIAATRTTPYALKPKRLPGTLSEAAKYLDRFFSTSVKYLGPLRDEPKPLYPLSHTVDPSDIGLRGEYTAAVLDRYKDKLITYIPTTNFPGAKDNVPLNQETSTRTLKAAVTDWLKYLEIADELRTKDMGKLGHELKVTLPGLDQEQDLMHVGVGVSQVVPILVLCLLAEPDTTLIFEQPELHLHPLVQTRLADFFLSMALLKKQCIIETHSEYLINRLRFRVASDPPPQQQATLAEKLKIYFAEKIEGVSRYREVTVNKYGAIVDWPQGFFDQSQREAEEILRASMAKRQQERQTKQQARQQQENQTDD